MVNKKINFNINKTKMDNNRPDFDHIVENYVKNGVLVDTEGKKNYNSEAIQNLNENKIQRTSVYVPKDIHLDLKILAARLNMSMSDVIVEAIRRYLKSH